jgi:hypothetical protein
VRRNRSPIVFPLLVSIKKIKFTWQPVTNCNNPCVANAFLKTDLPQFCGICVVAISFATFHLPQNCGKSFFGVLNATNGVIFTL